MESLKAVNPTVSGNFKSGESYRKWKFRAVLVFADTAFFVGKNEAGKIKSLLFGHEICSLSA